MEAISTTSDARRSVNIRERLEAYAELTKPRIAVMLVLVSAAAFYVGSAGVFNLPLFLVSMSGIGLLAFGVAALNQWFERYTDLLMGRTAGRPLPARRITNAEALVIGLFLCAAAEMLFFFYVNTLTAVLGVVVIVGYVLLYTPLKTRTSASTAIGALPGAMPPLMGWTAAANEITIVAWALFALLFLWQFPHFLAIAWLYKEEYAKAGIVMLPVVYPEGRLTARQIVLFSVMMVPVSLAPFFFGIAGTIFLAGATVIGLIFLWESIKTARARTKAASRRLLLVTVMYLPIYFVFLVVNRN